MDRREIVEGGMRCLLLESDECAGAPGTDPS
jgi:hypothetical protein